MLSPTADVMQHLVSLGDFRIAIIVAGLLSKPRISSVKDYLSNLAVPWSVFEKESVQFMSCVEEVLRSRDFQGLLIIAREAGIAEAIERTNYLDKRYEELRREIERLQQEISICRLNHCAEGGRTPVGIDGAELQIFGHVELERQQAKTSMPSKQSADASFAQSSDLRSKLLYLGHIRRIVTSARSSMRGPQNDYPIIDALDNVLTECVCEMETLLSSSLKVVERSKSEIMPEFSYTARIVSAANYLCNIICLLAPSIGFRFDSNDAQSQRVLFIITASVRKMFITLAGFLSNIECANSSLSGREYSECEYSGKVMVQVNVRNLIATLSQSFPEISFVLLYVVADILSFCTEVIREKQLSAGIFRDFEETLSLLKPCGSYIQDSVILMQTLDSKRAEFSAIIYARIIDVLLEFGSQCDTYKRISEKARSDVSSCMLDKCRVLLQDAVAYVPDTISQKIFDILVKVEYTQQLHGFNVEEYAESYLVNNVLRVFSSKTPANPQPQFRNG